MPSRLLRAAIMGLSFAGAASAGYVSAADASPTQSLRYQTTAGDSVQAILLKAPQQAAVLRDQVILFDTSASQTGMHRTQALQVLDRFLDALPAETRIRLFAIDVETAELTTGFAPAGSADVKKARALLARRAPLGATDLKAGLDDALKAAGDGASSVVYLGDGMSASHLLQNEELKGLLAQYRTRQIPVSSYAVGPRRDLQLLGIVAHWTGGAVLLDGEESNAVTAARELAKAVQQNVVYLDSLNVEPAGTTLLPGEALPLRADRATVVLTRGAVPTALHGTTAEGTLNWSIDATSPS